MQAYTMDYSAWKTLLALKRARHLHHETDRYWRVFFHDGTDTYECLLNKTGSADLTDWTENYQDTSNAPWGTVVRELEDRTFYVVAAGVAPANNKSMISIACTNAARRVRVLSIHLINASTSALTGVMQTFDLRRAASHAAGTDLSSEIERADTVDTLASGISVRTNATITSESTKLIKRTRWSSDEHGAGTLDQEGFDKGLTSLIPIWGAYRGAGEKPIVVRNGEALTLKQTVSSTAGSWDIHMTFTEENSL